MDAPPTGPARILIVARPALGRKVEAALRSAGHEVHRTPDPSAADALAAQLRPQAVVIALDLPWGDALAAADRLRNGERPVPVLLLVDELHGSDENGASRLATGAQAGDLQAAVAGLIP